MKCEEDPQDTDKPQIYILYFSPKIFVLVAMADITVHPNLTSKIRNTQGAEGKMGQYRTIEQTRENGSCLTFIRKEIAF